MRHCRSVLGGAVAAALVLGLCALAPLRAEPADDTVTITGLVRIAQFGARGETVRVYVDAAEEPVLVSRRDRGKELLALVGATVRATGYLRKIRSDEGFTKTIDVTEYVIEAPAVAKPQRNADHELSDD
jgi:hypothetical protein